jgi:hypothetical protein
MLGFFVFLSSSTFGDIQASCGNECGYDSTYPHSFLKISANCYFMLTDTRIRTAKAESKAYKLTDAHGLHLLVNPTGSKLWQLRYRF